MNKRMDRNRLNIGVYHLKPDQGQAPKQGSRND